MDNSGVRQVGSLPRGFAWGAVKGGIKASGKLDVALAVAPRGANAAAMFTRNQVVAAPVTVGRVTAGRATGFPGARWECPRRRTG